MYDIIAGIIIVLVMATLAGRFLILDHRAAAAQFDKTNEALRKQRAHDLAVKTGHPAGRALRDREINRGADWN